MVYRPRWARTWHAIKYCSDACRKKRHVKRATSMEQAILTLLAARPRGATLCPSEAARAVLGADGLGQEAMQQARYAANRLVVRGLIVITQGGQIMDPSRAKGPIRLRLVDR